MKIAEKEFEGKHLMKSAGFRVPGSLGASFADFIACSVCKLQVQLVKLAPGTRHFFL